jgi:hypothetical protein
MVKFTVMRKTSGVFNNPEVFFFFSWDSESAAGF